MRRILALAAVLTGLGIGTYAAQSQTTLMIAETWSGDVFVLGEGDTCLDAWTNHAPIPEDWRELRCDVENTLF
jgi:hypothetical protein